MGGWLRYLELKVKVKTGLSSGVFISAAIAAACAAIASVFFLFGAFIWLAERYTPLTAALVLAGFFLLVAIIALISCLMTHSRNIESARVELAARNSQPWFDPKYLGIGMQVARTIGWRRIVPLIAVGILAAGLAKEWGGFGQSSEPDEADDADDDDQDAGDSREAA